MLQNDLYTSFDNSGIVFLPVKDINELRIKTSINGLNIDNSVAIMTNHDNISIWNWDVNSIEVDDSASVIKVLTISIGRWKKIGEIPKEVIDTPIYINQALNSSTANNINVDFNPALTNLKDGQEIFVLTSLSNTGSVNITVNSLPLKVIVKSGNVNLTKNDIRQNHLLHLVYSQTYDKFVLLNPDYTFLITNSITDAINNFAINIDIYPKILTPTNKLTITASGNAVVIAAGEQFRLNGNTLINTSDYILSNRTLNTVANKTYHLRYNIAQGFYLSDMANLVETQSQFDSTPTDMLIARVVTNSAGTITIRPLKNLSGIMSTGYYATSPSSISTATGVRLTAGGTFDYARTPVDVVWLTSDFYGNNVSPGLLSIGINVTISITRYSASVSALFAMMSGNAVIRAKFETR